MKWSWLHWIVLFAQISRPCYELASWKVVPVVDPDSCELTASRDFNVCVLCVQQAELKPMIMEAAEACKHASAAELERAGYLTDEVGERLISERWCNYCWETNQSRARCVYSIVNCEVPRGLRSGSLCAATISFFLVLLFCLKCQMNGRCLWEQNRVKYSVMKHTQLPWNPGMVSTSAYLDFLALVETMPNLWRYGTVPLRCWWAETHPISQ